MLTEALHGQCESPLDRAELWEADASRGFESRDIPKLTIPRRGRSRRSTNREPV